MKVDDDFLASIVGGYIELHVSGVRKLSSGSEGWIFKPYYYKGIITLARIEGSFCILSSKSITKGKHGIVGSEDFKIDLSKTEISEEGGRFSILLPKSSELAQQKTIWLIPRQVLKSRSGTYIEIL